MDISPEAAAQKARKYCAYQERSQQEVRNRLYSWGLHRQQVEQTIALLITENFINEERFAIAFAGGKFRIKHWGRIKIKAALAQKKVSPYCIKKALEQIPEKDYRNALQKIIVSHGKKIAEKDPVKKNYRIAQYLLSRGFEKELVWSKLLEDLNSGY
jgi:regulatory protein